MLKMRWNPYLVVLVKDCLMFCTDNAPLASNRKRDGKREVVFFFLDEYGVSRSNAPYTV
jgi:hypothetical protein